ncbi:squalene synthetase-like protein [Paecilomyces lecythidis]|uniref:Protein SQS1 n=1 Tax=Paecilomyces lecythidis TaxID=3004212 RepID=A0ABR3WS84_9EURO
MQQEARNTGKHSVSWETSRLRFNKVNFVKAGKMHLNELNEESTEHQTESQETKEEPQPQSESQKEPKTVEEAEDSGDTLFFVDCDGDKPATTGLVDPVARLELSSAEDSSEDEVVFPGRNAYSEGNVSSREKSREGVRKYDDDVGNFLFSAATGDNRPTDQNRSNARTEGANPGDGRHTALNTELDTVEQTSVTAGSRSASQSAKATVREFSQADILADYIENIDPEYRALYLEHDREGWDTENASDSLDSDDDGPGALSEVVAEKHVRQSKGTRKSDTASDDEFMSDSSSEVEGDLASEGDEQSSDEEDSPDYSDEQLARALQMQEGLGIALDEILLFEQPSNPRSARASNPKHGKSNGRPRQKKASRESMFVSASALADALDEDPYYGFDIMDLDRPSLRKKPKGRRRGLNFELSDSETEEQLERAWTNDREKKKIKKRQREELRSQGQLGRKPGKVDMKAKYSKGISIDNVKSEIRSFLLTSAESLPLPPMDKKYRKIVHEIANAVSLKSQSRGNGPSRFPVLYKTSRTPKFTQRNISDIDRAFSRGGRARAHGGGKGAQASGKRGRPNAAASYADGEIVGASAPEIGAENKGRAMLEKMGWSSGTALGAQNNKGILHPVAHVVKNSRTGLG